MTDAFFFGYGSLVNRRTHAYAQTRPARLTGWRRVWRHTALRPVAFLSVEPFPGQEVEGLIAAVPGADWSALDAREWAYARHRVSVQVLSAQAGAFPAEVYAVTAPEVADGTRHPVLLSYVDAVVQGYLEVFGEAGAERFFATTAGWDLTVLNDRAAPRYPRAQDLSAGERVVVDAALARLGVSVGFA